ncbi:MAG: hypothetical protein JW837_10165 [Sedimentisphaerales bacterium]|nr:hypothetical protein [Sedimentisphaerales bacterium]
MTHLKKFTSSMEKASQSDPMMQRWLYGTKELERQLSERLIRLCKYPDMIPKSLLASYADVLLEALENEQVNGTFSAFSEDLLESLIALTETLEKSGNPQMEQKGRRIREIIGK